MERKIFFLTMLVLFSSCKKAEHDDTYLELNNKVLESEIIRYTQKTKAELKGEPFVISVYCKQINDSTARYVISPEITASLMENWPYSFICKVGGRDVFFVMGAGISFKNNFNGGNFFKLKQRAYEDFMKKYFPKQYETYLKILHNEEVETTANFYDPELCYLTFVNEKLVSKIFEMGLPTD
jgi:hypothetical protein